jgi:hypothetical protein
VIRLTQTFGAHAGRVREFDQEVVRCGRLPTNDFAFDPHADLDASGNHAEIRRDGPRWVIVDAGSRNGTLVNGRPVQRHTLEGNEEIEFGTGGPRVKVEIVHGAIPAGSIRNAQPTAPATPIELGGAGAPPVDMAPPTAAGTSPPPPVWTGGNNSPARGNTPPPAGDPKMYGQRTLDMAIQSAETRGRAQGAATGAGGPAELARLEATNKQSRTVIFALGAMVVLLLGLCCLLGSGLAFVLFRQ